MLNEERLHDDLVPRQAPELRPRPPRPYRQISGQSLAKTDLNPRQRACVAAGWVTGSIAIHPPTVALAAKVFGVSAQLIRGAIDELEATTIPQSPLAAAWSLAGLEGRSEFVRDHLAEIWNLVDVATA